MISFLGLARFLRTTRYSILTRLLATWSVRKVCISASISSCIAYWSSLPFVVPNSFINWDLTYISLAFSPRGKVLSSRHFDVSELLKWSMSNNTLMGSWEVRGVPSRFILSVILIPPLLTYISTQTYFSIRGFKCCIYAFGHWWLSICRHYYSRCNC